MLLHKVRRPLVCGMATDPSELLLFITIIILLLGASAHCTGSNYATVSLGMLMHTPSRHHARA